MSLIKEKLHQLQADVTKHELSTSDHSASLFYSMFGGKEEIASILASMISRINEHILLRLTASPFYHAPEDEDGTTVDCDGHGTTWCVHCCFKSPLSPCFL